MVVTLNTTTQDEIQQLLNQRIEDVLAQLDVNGTRTDGVQPVRDWWTDFNVSSNLDYIAPAYSPSTAANQFHHFYKAFNRDNDFEWVDNGLPQSYKKGLFGGAMVFVCVGLLFLFGPLLARCFAKICHCCKSKKIPKFGKMSNLQKSKWLIGIFSTSVVCCTFGLLTLAVGFVILNRRVAPSLANDLDDTGSVVNDANTIALTAIATLTTFSSYCSELASAMTTNCPGTATEEVAKLEQVPEKTAELNARLAVVAQSDDLSNLSNSLYDASHVIDISDPYRQAIVGILVIFFAIVTVIAVITFIATKRLSKEAKNMKERHFFRYCTNRCCTSISHGTVYMLVALSVILCSFLMGSVGISGMLLGDYCQNPNQSTLQVSGLTGNKIVEYYMTCDESSIESANLDEAKAKLQEVADELAPILQWVQDAQPARRSLQTVAGKVQDAIASGEFDVCSQSTLDKAAQVTKAFFAVVMLVELVSAKLSCPIINDLYVQIVYNDLCTDTVKSIAWVLWGSLITAFGMSLLGISLALLVRFIKRDAHVNNSIKNSKLEAEKAKDIYNSDDEEMVAPVTGTGLQDVPLSPKA